MTRDRDRDLERICQDALERPVAERADFLVEACAADEELRREAEALLAHDGADESFLATPALAVAARELGTADPALAAGQQFGPYTIVSRLGAGGMGEVYRGRDHTLRRDVAIKVLPTLFTSDPGRLARFESEARVLASLNHPNIATIHGLEHVGGIHALVLEVVEGETLADRLQSAPGHRPARAGLPIADALTIARQVAEALEAAHEQGIVHRDLKPANVKVRPDDVVKVLDFGLAKMLAVDPAVSLSPTITAADAGVVVGTPPYMSPEQAKGGAVDRRSDIFAFGCLLYEMLTGRPAFDGGSASEIMARVIEREPDWSALPPALHPRIQELLRRCLEKDPKKRRRDIRDVRIDIEHVLSGPAQTATPVVDVASRQPARLAWIVATILAVALAVAITRPFFAVPAETPETRVDIDTPAMPEPTAFEISPDGRRLVFVAFRNGQPQLHVRSLDGTTVQLLAGTEGGRLPFWSPDGRSVGFFVPGSLKVIDLDRGVVRTVANVNSAGMGGAWGPDGTILFAQSGPLFTVPASGGEPVAVTTLVAGQATHQWPLFLPGGRQFLFHVPGTADAQGIYLGSLDSRETTRLTVADTNGVYVSPGWLLYGRQGALVARRFDPVRRALSGDPVTVDGSVAVGPVVPRLGASASTAGVIAYRTTETTTSQLTWFDRSGRRHETLGEPDHAGPWNVELSHDGNRAAVERPFENRTVIRIIDSARTTLFTLEKHIERFPLWSRDDTRMAYSSNQMGSRSFSVRAPNDASSTEVLREGLAAVPCDWSPDGRFLLYFGGDNKTGPDLWVLPVDGDRKPFKFLGTAARELWGQFSPNGKWVAYQSDESGKFEIYVRPFPGGRGGVMPVSTSGGIHPRWNADGTELFYVAPDGKLMAAPMAATGGTLEAGIPVVLFQTHIVGGGNNIPGYRQQYDVARDGRFLINVALESDSPPITLLFNWTPRLK